jgi:arabinose-5-phosphate isomerase
MPHGIDYAAIAREVFEIEAAAVLGLADALDGGFSAAVAGHPQGPGRVIVCGMGKSGIIGKKIAATLASTGTPSFFMHPGEAFHGDLGMVTPTTSSSPSPTPARPKNWSSCCPSCATTATSPSP